MSPQFDPEVGLITKIDLELKLPAGFPEKYRAAVVNAMNLCTVKKHLHQPPEFAITDGGRLMADEFDPTHAERLEDPARLAALPQSAVVELLRLRRRRDRGRLRRRDGHLHGRRGGGRAERQGSSPSRRCRSSPRCCVRRSRRSSTARLCIVRDRRQRRPGDDDEADRVVDGRCAAPPVRPARGARRSRPRC